jgi:hypothetical protein
MCENGLLFFRSFVGVVLNVLLWIWHVIAVELIINVLNMYPNVLVEQFAPSVSYSRGPEFTSRPGDRHA